MTPENFPDPRCGLFQELLSCSPSSPERMFSTSAISELRPALRRSLPVSYTKTSGEFPWSPRPAAPRSPPRSSRHRRRRREDGGLATAFSTRLSVQELEEILETLPRPENQRSLNTNCVRSFTDYHRSLQEKEKEEEELAVAGSLPATRRTVRRRARQVEERGGRGGLRLLTARDRHLLLRSQGVARSDRSDREAGGEISNIQTSRLTAGCSCSDGCGSAECECGRHKIPCQREFSGFPCGCTGSCSNPAGRREFDDLAVSLHFISTMMRMFTVEGVMELTDNNGQQAGPGYSKRRKR